MTTPEHVIIDGYNVLFGVPRFRDAATDDLERARDALLHWLDGCFRDRSARVTVVFDGCRQPDVVATGRRGRVAVIFTRAPEDADARIQRLVDAERRRARGAKRLPVRVVTSDAEVAGRARLWGARAVSITAFLADLEPPPPGTRADSTPRTRRGRRRESADPGASPRARPGRREVDELERLFRESRDPDGESE